MNNHTMIWMRNLQLFAEGGAGAAGTGEGGSDAGSQVEAQLSQDAQEVQQSQEQSAEPTFKELIKGKYKADYDAAVQKAIQGRMRGANANAERLAKMEPLMRLLGQRYNQDPGNIEGLMAALDNDESLWQSEAMARGMSVDQYKQIRTMERENEAQKLQVMQLQREQTAREEYGRWLQQAELAKAKYPELDLESCLEDEQFGMLLQSGVDVETAYVARYHDEIMQAGMAHAAQEAERKLSSSVAAGARRPAEGGTGNGAAVTTKVDVSKMSRSEFMSYMDKVMRGERVSFG
nr:MAG TPA: Stationary phase protein 4 [Caudoviricetes sp.]